MNIHLKLVNPRASVPVYATEGAAAFDFFVPAGESYSIAPGGSLKISSGVAAAIPDGYVMFLFSRSGHGAKHGIRLSNCVGVIDSDYRGEVIGSIANDSSVSFTLAPGERFMQGIVLQRPTVSFTMLGADEDLPPTQRGAGGFGSTGTAEVPSNNRLVLPPGVRPRPRSTHTLATMGVTDSTYNEIANKLRAAGYDHAFCDDGIDLTGLMLVRN